MCMKTARERFVSLFWCYLNPEGTCLSYINAGHLPALLVRERFGRPDVWRAGTGWRSIAQRACPVRCCKAGQSRY